jgi:RNA polymerase sigma-70 factor (ECF subfamily)
MVEAFEAELLAILPRLRGTAFLFTRDRSAADDLLQESLVLAFAAKQRYTPGTNMAGWMYRLMRNRFISLLRRQKAPTVPLDDRAARILRAPGSQEEHITQWELERELAALSVGQREALLLVAAAGHSYVEAAAAMGCTVDTAKTRVSRARAKLRARFREADRPEAGPDVPKPAHASP